MPKKLLNITQVKFPAKANPELRTQLIQSAEKAGLLWSGAGAEVVAREVQRVCVWAAHAAIVDMAMNWKPEQWEAAMKRLGVED